MKASITAIRPERRFTTGDGSEMADLSVAFADGSVGHVYGPPGKVAAHVEALTKLIGVESEFELEEGKPYQGQANWKVKSYEGDPRKQGRGGGGGWKGKTPEERSEIAAQNALTAAAHVAAALIAAGSVRVNAEMAGAYVVQLQAQFFGSTRTLAGSMSSGTGDAGTKTTVPGTRATTVVASPSQPAPEHSLGESGEGDKPPSATGSPESSEGGDGASEFQRQLLRKGASDVTTLGRGAETAPPSEPPTPLGEYAGSASPVDNGPDFGDSLSVEAGVMPSGQVGPNITHGDSLFGSNGPASPTQLERLAVVFGSAVRALKAANERYRVGALSELSAEQAATLIEEQVGVRG